MANTVFDIYSSIARKKGGFPDHWCVYKLDSVIGGILVTGCMTRPKKRGQNKGDPFYVTNKMNAEVIITKSDIEEYQNDIKDQQKVDQRFVPDGES